MNTEVVTLHVENDVATITLNRPEVKNALNQEAHEQLYDAFEEADERKDVKVIVLTGSGDAFCSGADLKAVDLNDIENFNYGRVLRETYNRLITLMSHIGKPIIASINGIAVGAGLSIALACDYRVANKEAVFGLGFLKIGLVPDAGASYFLPRLVGYPTALELALKDTFDVNEAKSIGLINSIGELDTYVERCKKLPPTAYRLMKENFRESFDHHLAEVLEREVTAQREASESKEHRMALAHFVNKKSR
ncbi:enoyl-CoA hydratase [Bacillus sp. JCM 19046]|uniref:2-(1,2-epoxy-1,2-dihydrophenyl)acetyl-CoA isomerase n=1 Tax=Shouchella xiaoxiensis TaxID=766895 RepID=A0ABS2T1M2_9BACI|nr:enoyl-CoA hydratase/isomerase family protein [Shouchella xiaoxiensis]MBM7840594.1 2-(1,2-epoxy-1,2-dihydrophenyl)acetyl-CoA isomerase [Shouchella xiaoxiensis]GAF12744.1 enoyl-CoA hydratase [Bacillus sp. JCM 19045]GAF16857.1 enoyl-CoA hydratase [Bacillus sp. JCM 19046]